MIASKLLRKNIEKCRSVRGDMLKVPNKVIFTSALIRFICLAQSHLLMNDWSEQCLWPQKSSFVMKIVKQMPERTINLPAM